MSLSDINHTGKSVSLLCTKEESAWFSACSAISCPGLYPNSCPYFYKLPPGLLSFQFISMFSRTRISFKVPLLGGIKVLLLIAERVSMNPP